MNRVLRSVETTPFFGGDDSPRFLDPEEAARVEVAVADAYEQGFNEGRRTGRSEAEHAARLIDRALSDASTRAEQHRNAAVTEAVSLGLAVADAALGEDRFLTIEQLSDRIQSAVASLDDTELVVSVNPGDVEPLADHMSPRTGVEIRADRSVRSGEATITGSWSNTAITKDAALAVVREALS